MTISFRSTISQYIPAWLKARAGKQNAFKYLYTIALLADAGIEHAYQGVQGRFPGIADPSVLPYIGRDRRIRRAPGESGASYAARLLRWRQDWKQAGSALAVMQQVRASLTPFVPRMRVVNNSGFWVTLEPDDSVSMVNAGNWDWDGNTGASYATRCWLIIYADMGVLEPLPSWGDSELWGGSWGGSALATCGTSATPAQVAAISAALVDFKGAHSNYVCAIVAFDPASFDPEAPLGDPGLPDGTWGHWSKNVAGVQVPARLSTARYFDGVA